MESAARRVFGAACFQEIRTPVFESTELFERGVGDATDIVGKEMYTFESRSGKRLTLRPENTAGVARAFLEHGMRGRLPMPHKLWYAGPMFRYERPQKGRQRQFHQLGVEILDTASPMADAEAVLVACEFLREVGLSDLVVEVNSLGDGEDRVRYREALVEFLRSVADRLDEDSVGRIETNPLRVLDSKNRETRKALEGAPSILDFLGEDSAEHFAAVKEQLDALGIAYRVVPTLVRGLDYYSRTTFEIQAEGLGAQSTVCGGGRYDGLVEALGGPPVSAVGWALGLERLAMVLDAAKGEPSPEGPTAFLVAIGDEARSDTHLLARDLRRKGVRAEVSFSGAGIGRQMKAADRRGSRFVVLIGGEEATRHAVAVKELETGEQREVPLSELADSLGPEGGGQ
jgi:histidyl-tRNA synthetase